MRGVIDVNDEQRPRMVRQGRIGRARRSTGAQRARGVAGRGARAHVQGRHRRPPRIAEPRRHRGCSELRRHGAGLRPDGQPVPTTSGQVARSPASTSVADPYAAATAPTWSWCSPSGPSSRSSTSTRLAGVMAGTAPSSTPATCSIRRRSARRAQLRRRRAGRADGDGARRGHRRRRLPRFPPLSTAARPRRRRGCDRQPRHRRRSPTSSQLFGRRGFTFVEHDVSSYLLGARRTSTRSCTSPARRRRPTSSGSRSRPSKVGSLGTHNCLGLAGQGRPLLPRVDARGVRRPARAPAARDVLGQRQPDRARGVYDEAKRFAEAMTMAYHRHHGLDVRIVRIFNTVLADEQVLYDDGVELRRERSATSPTASATGSR